MEFKESSVVMIFLLLTFLSLNSPPCSGAGDSIGSNKSIFIGLTIVSSGGNFELGFFTPGNSSNYYIGIWYKKLSPQTVIWVANRDTPITFPEMTNAEFTIKNGNLLLLNGTQQLIWSTNVNSTMPDSVIAILGDDGNLVMRDGSNSSNSLWESFDNPTHTLMPGGRLRYNKHTKAMQYLRSWRNSEDPSPGPYSVEIIPRNGQFGVLWNKTEEYWSSGTWNGYQWSSVPYVKPNTTVNYTYINDTNEVSYTYDILNPLIISRFVLDVTGEIKQFTWLDSTKQWNVFFSQPVQPCNVYAYCGAFGTCNQSTSPLCTCLPGFIPRLNRDWDSDIFSQGCVRKTHLSCGNSSTPLGDMFRKMIHMTLPKYNLTVRVNGEAECESTCFRDCTCTAYAYDNSECLTWSGELLNLKQVPKDDATGRTLYVKLAASDFPSDTAQKKTRSTRDKAIISASTIVAAILVCCLAYIYYRRRIAQRSVQGNLMAQWQSGVDGANDLTNEEDGKGIDVPFFSLESILAATDRFSEINKLGQGGFGPVYKGIFPGGREIAVKRLSTESGQGIEEFKNEVILIARLQHRNLVKLLGYCITGNEKILLYEYMPNKSLDTFIFDREICITLDWKKRYDIILGIARGLLYLHHDSRVRIIHRDLKTSNILLDEVMNPKISDFGLARIVEGNATQANTKKVVGTYGYMAPEYALDGLFSIKSDVFSFGVVVLEIISGRKNTGFYESEEAMNLLGYAWRLWTEEKETNLLHESLLETCDLDEAFKCINIGMLCIQESPSDRPSMADVMIMLCGESMTFPRPKQPAFVAKNNTFSSSNTTSSTNNGLTITVEAGR